MTRDHVQKATHVGIMEYVKTMTQATYVFASKVLKGLTAKTTQGHVAWEILAGTMERVNTLVVISYANVGRGSAVLPVKTTLDPAAQAIPA